MLTCLYDLLSLHIVGDVPVAVDAPLEIPRACTPYMPPSCPPQLQPPRESILHLHDSQDHDQEQIAWQDNGAEQTVFSEASHEHLHRNGSGVPWSWWPR